MNVLVVHNYYAIRGGEDAVFEQETKALKEMGVNISTYTRNNSETNTKSIVKKIKIILEILFPIRQSREINKLIKQNKIQLIHIHNVFPLITPVIYKIAYKNNIPVVQTLHNYRFICPNGLMFRKNEICTECIDKSLLSAVKNRCYKDSLLFSLLYVLLLKKYKKYIQQTTSIIGLQKFTLAKMSNFFKNSLHYIKPNGIEPHNIKRSESGKYFLFIGRLSNEKGILELVDFFNHNLNFKLKIIGTGQLENELRKRIISNNIELLGFKTGTEKNELICNASAIIIPSIWYENYPVVVVEAFSYGIPVIANKLGGLSAIVKDRYSGILIDKGDETALLEALDFLSDDKNRKDLGENAYKYFTENMTNEKTLNQLVKIYKKTLHNHKNNVRINK